MSHADMIDAMFERDFLQNGVVDRLSRGSKKYFQEIVMPGRVSGSDPHQERKPSRTSAMPAAGGLAQLRALLCSQNPESAGTTFVAIDSETESNAQNVVEVGITTLSTSDITNTEPGENLVGWMPKMKHYHVRRSG